MRRLPRGAPRCKSQRLLMHSSTAPFLNAHRQSWPRLRFPIVITMQRCEREVHGAGEGVYVTDSLESVTDHYAWATTAFGDKSCSVIILSVLGSRERLVNDTSKLDREWIFHKEGVFVMHICVVHNKSIRQSRPRLQYFHPEAEFHVTPLHAPSEPRIQCLVGFIQCLGRLGS